MSEKLIVRGARVHNLKNVSLEIPRNKMVVFTGISGSGKSSLAFDTIFAEGQRRYVESLSAYARQFLGEMDKPDVDHIEGLSPAISIDQKGSSRNPRSTVGTITEIYDYLRVLWARVGRPRCPACGSDIERQTSQQIIEQLMRLPEGERFMILAPVVRGRKGEYKELFQGLRKQGYLRVRVDGEIRELEEEIVLDKNYKHDVEVVVDRLVMKEDLRRRVADSVEQALGLSEGLLSLYLVDQEEERFFSERFSCAQCGFSFPEISPRLFSFNSPYGACPSCSGLGVKMDIDPELLISDPGLSVWEAFVPLAEREIHWRKLQSLAEQEGIDLSAPWVELGEKERLLVLYGSPEKGSTRRYRNRFGKTRTYNSQYEGVVTALLRRHKETDSEWTREKVEELMFPRECESCQGARLRPESLSVLLGGNNIFDFCRLPIKESLVLIREIKLSPSEQIVARRLL